MGQRRTGGDLGSRRSRCKRLGVFATDVLDVAWHSLRGEEDVELLAGLEVALDGVRALVG